MDRSCGAGEGGAVASQGWNGKAGGGVAAQSRAGSGSGLDHVNLLRSLAGCWAGSSGWRTCANRQLSEVQRPVWYRLRISQPLKVVHQSALGLGPFVAPLDLPLPFSRG